MEYIDLVARYIVEYVPAAWHLRVASATIFLTILAAAFLSLLVIDGAVMNLPEFGVFAVMFVVGLIFWLIGVTTAAGSIRYGWLVGATFGFLVLVAMFALLCISAAFEWTYHEIRTRRLIRRLQKAR